MRYVCKLLFFFYVIDGQSLDEFSFLFLNIIIGKNLLVPCDIEARYQDYKNKVQIWSDFNYLSYSLFNRVVKIFFSFIKYKYEYWTWLQQHRCWRAGWHWLRLCPSRRRLRQLECKVICILKYTVMVCCIAKRCNLYGLLN